VEKWAAEFEDALSQLYSWGAVDGQPASDFCEAPPRAPAQYFTLARLALLRASSSDDNGYLKVALRLGRSLRRGRDLPTFFTGVRVAEDVARWAKSRNVPMSGALAAMAPSSEELIGALARQHRCSERYYREKIEAYGMLERIMFSPQRELLMLHWCAGNQFRRARQHIQHGRAAQAAALYRFDTTDDLPKSLACRSTASNVEQPILRAVQAIDEYQRAIVRPGG
jgi:hypothetical protein